MKRKQEISNSPTVTEPPAHGGEVKPHQAPAPPEVKLEAFLTEDFDTAEFLNQKGVHPVACTGTPIKFEYSLFDSHKIKKLLLERMGGKG